MKTMPPRALGIHILTGAHTRDKFLNLLHSLTCGSVSVYQVIARKK